MALLQLLSEESLAEEHVDVYFGDLYRIVCVGERMDSPGQTGGIVRSTYLVDWEQLVHLLEGYTHFDEDIVEVQAVGGEEAHQLRPLLGSSLALGRA
ncbi:MAG: hypothetical protein ACR2GA_03560 [Chloroflexota bacterium]